MTFNTNDDLRAPPLNLAVGVVRCKDIEQVVNNSTVLVLDESLVWDLEVSAVYTLTGCIGYLTTSVPDIKLGWTLPANASMLWHATGMSSSSVHLNFANGNPTGGTTNFGGSDGITARVARFAATIVTGDTDGQVGLQFAQVVATAVDTSVTAGSFGVLKRIT